MPRRSALPPARRGQRLRRVGGRQSDAEPEAATNTETLRCQTASASSNVILRRIGTTSMKPRQPSTPTSAKLASSSSATVTPAATNARHRRRASSAIGHQRQSACRPEPRTACRDHRPPVEQHQPAAEKRGGPYAVLSAIGVDEHPRRCERDDQRLVRHREPQRAVERVPAADEPGASAGRYGSAANGSVSTSITGG